MFFLLFWLAFILTLQINNFICGLTCNFDLLRRCNVFYTWQHESCSIWSHATTSVPVYDNCTGCQSLNESQALFSRPQRSSWTSAGLHYWLTSAGCHHFIAVLVASRQSWRLCLSCHGQIEDSQIQHSPLLHHGRGTNCRLISKWHN